MALTLCTNTLYDEPFCIKRNFRSRVHVKQGLYWSDKKFKSTVQHKPSMPNFANVCYIVSEMKRE
jgi:hypothetical protein